MLKKTYCLYLASGNEHIAGFKSIKQFSELNKVLKVYFILHLDEEISKRALQIYKKFILSQHIKLFVCLIAASSLEKNILIHTDNKNYFNFIDEVKFYKEKQYGYT